MKKREGFLVFVVVFSLVFLSQLVCSYGYNYSNLSLDENQIYGDPISGSFFLSLTDAPVNLLFSSEFGKISLQELLINDGKSLGCEYFNCSGTYAVDNNGSSSLNLVTNPGGSSFGLLFNGEQITSMGLSMDVSAIFPESDSIPLSILIGKNYRLNFDSASENLSNIRQITYGCFNPSATLKEGYIDYNGYCEEVNLTGSKSYFLGANISGPGLADFVFSLKQDGSDIATCSKTVESANYSEPIGCFASLSEKQSSGKYEVCIRTQSEGKYLYTIKKETVGINCGRYSSGDKLADYSLFVKVPYYASSSGLINLGEEFSSSSIDSINNYLSSVYSGKCSSGCVVPVVFYGNYVNLTISNINSDYSSITGPEKSTLLYSLKEDVFKINFYDSILLKSFNWISSSAGSKSFTVNLEENGEVNKLFSTNILIKSVPFARNIYPLNPPAGLDSYFYVVIDSNFTKLIWDFGDGSSLIETTNSFAKHKYLNVSKEYNISITTIGINSSIKRSFIITTTSPQNYINETLSLKRKDFNNINNEVNNLPVLYKDFIKEKLQLNSIQEELVQIEIDKTRALSSEDFLNIANKINSLIIPLSINIYDSKSGILDSTYTSIDPSIISKIVPGNYSAFDEYKSAIYSWQLKNFYSNMTKKKIRALRDNNENVELVTVYEINLRSKSNDTAYFVIREPKANIYFNSGVDSLDIETNVTYIEFLPGQEKTISFFVEGAKDLNMFISPALEVLPAEQEVSVCNVNGICQKDIGENSDNCRTDCMPVFSTTLIIISILIFMLVVYTVLQIWYVSRYEKYLFKERVHVFNLIAFINNSKLSAKSRGDIMSALVSSGWSSEQIEYAIKKSEGKNTGMFELLPVQKLIAYLEMKKAEKIKSVIINPPSNANSIPRSFSNRPSVSPKPQYRRGM